MELLTWEMVGSNCRTAVWRMVVWAAVVLFNCQAANAKTERYIIRGNPTQIKQIAKSAGYKVVKVLKKHSAVVVEIDPAFHFFGRQQIEKDVIFKASMGCLPIKPDPDAPLPNPNPPTQIAPWGIKRIQARQAFSITKGKGTVACIVDTGCQEHDDLGDNLGERISFVENETENDGNGHGTHIAGTIAALDNGIGVVGVAPESKVICAKGLDNAGSGFSSDLADAIRWCMEKNADVINASWGSSQPSPIIEDAINAAVAKGITFVAAAGNESGPVGYPAKYSTAVAISATDINDGFASFSNQGPEIQYAAPGVSVLSLALNNRYVEFSGTSMATPHAVGVYLLMRAAKKLKPVAIDIGLGTNKQGKGLIHAAKTVGL